MRIIGCLALSLFLFGCSTVNRPAAANPVSAGNPIVAEYQRLHAASKELRQDSEKCFDRPNMPTTTDAIEEKYRAQARKILVLDALMAATQGKTKEEIVKQTDAALASMVVSAPVEEIETAIEAIEIVKGALPKLACILDFGQKDKTLRSEIGEAREKPLLAIARGQLSSREQNEIPVFSQLINEQFKAIADELKTQTPERSK